MKSVILGSLLAAVAAMTPADITLSAVRDTDLFAGEKFETGYAKLTDGNMFFWLFPSRNNVANAPLVMWLNGGPGCASDFGAMKENGPISIQKDGTTKSNPHSWTNNANMVYVDQPLSVGFSESSNGYQPFKDYKVVAQNLRDFLENLLVLRPEFQGRDFYISGESYGGHYIPRVGSKLLEQPVQGLNFAGVAIGNGWYSAELQYPAYATFGREEGLIGESTYNRLMAQFSKCASILAKRPNDFIASAACSSGRQTVFGNHNPYDYRLIGDYDDSDLDRFLNRADVQKALNVGKKRWVMCDNSVYSHLSSDINIDSRKELAELIAAGLKTLVFAGDKDIICNWKGNEQVVYKLDQVSAVGPKNVWTKSSEMENKQFEDFKTKEGKTVGQMKTVDNVTFLRVFGAGHMVPMDQPEAGSAMIDAFLANDIAPRVSVSSTNDIIRI